METSSVRAIFQKRQGSMDEQPCLLDEDLPQAGLPEGVVLEVEAVEAVEGVLVRMHVQCVHVQIIPAAVQCRC